MRAVQIARTGGPAVLEAVERPVPAPAPGEILIRQEAIGLNFIDTYFRSGLYPTALPTLLGQEGAGVVEAVGPGVRRFKPGDRAGYASVPFTAYAEAACVPEGRAVRLPDGVSPRTAAACLVKGMTAEYLLRRTYPVKAGDAILVHAAAGGVGSILVQWAKALGAMVIGTAGSPDKARRATGHGCDHVILYGQVDVAARVREITGGAGVQAAYDSVGAATIDASLASLAPRGMLVSYGNASGPPPPIDPLRLMRAGSLFLTRPNLADYTTTPEELDDSAGALFKVIASGAVVIEIGQTWPLAEAAAAHAALEARRTVGSSLLIP